MAVAREQRPFGATDRLPGVLRRPTLRRRLFGKPLKAAEVQALHARRAMLTRRAERLGATMRALAEEPAEAGAIKFVGKYGRAQRGRAVAQGSFLERRREGLGKQLSRTGVELGALHGKLRQHDKDLLKRVGWGAAALGSVAGGAALWKTKRGRKLLGKALVNFRPLQPVEAALRAVRRATNARITAGAKEAERLVFQPAAERGVKAISDRILGGVVEVPETYARTVFTGTSLVPKVSGTSRAAKSVRNKQAKALSRARVQPVTKVELDPKTMTHDPLTGGLYPGARSTGGLEARSTRVEVLRPGIIDRTDLRLQNWLTKPSKRSPRTGRKARLRMGERFRFTDPSDIRAYADSPVLKARARKLYEESVREEVLGSGMTAPPLGPKGGTRRPQRSGPKPTRAEAPVRVNVPPSKPPVVRSPAVAKGPDLVSVDPRPVTEKLTRDEKTKLYRAGLLGIGQKGFYWKARIATADVRRTLGRK